MKRTMNSARILSVLLVLSLSVLPGCVPGGGTYTHQTPAGFFSGVWHGWIAPFSLIIGLFNDSVRIYEPNNTGWLYDLGFYIAIIGGFGGISLTRSRLKNRAKSQS
jgi:hypothetical protein